MGAREKLAARRARETRYAIWIADPTEPAARLQEAKGRLLMAGIGKEPGDPAIALLEQQVEQAEAALDRCREWLVFQALPPAEYEALIQEHPPLDGAHPDDVYDAETFVPALLAKCCQDSDITAEEWAGELAKLSVSEKAELTREVVGVNTTTWSTSIPKG